MSKRDYILEIISWRTRNGNAFTVEIVGELNKLKKQWDEGLIRENGLQIFAPIRVATILEVLSKKWVGILIDHGNPYTENAVEIAKNINIKLDFNMLSAVQGKKISLGELVSHNISYNNLSQIDSNFSAIIGEKLKTALSGLQVPIFDETGITGKESIITDVEFDYSAVEATFTARHILIHEIPEESPIKDEEIEAGITSAMHFATALDALLYTRLYGDTPLTQSDMNNIAREQFLDKERELGELMEKFPRWQDSELFRNSHYHWGEFLHNHSLFVAGYDQELPGSMAPLLYDSERQNLTDQRIKSLSQYAESFEDPQQNIL